MYFLYEFPEQAAYGANLPKARIYKYASPGAKVKNLFVQEVEKITWAYKLSPKTINVPACKLVREIQVITIALRTGSLKNEVLYAIDKAVPSPIIFELIFKNKIKYAAAFKRPSEADKNKWVTSYYFESDWMHCESTRKKLPVVLDMGVLYNSMLKNLIPCNALENETLADLVTRMETLKTKENEAVRIEARIIKEKQFNRKVELNRQLNELKKDIKALKI